MNFSLLFIRLFAVICPYLLFAQAPVLQWQKSLGGSGKDWANDIQQTNDGGFIVAGYTLSNNGDITNNRGGSDMWVVKLNANGNIQWQKTLGGAGEDVATAIKQTPDGGYIVVGWSSSFDGDIQNDNNGGYDYWVVKLTATGNISWAKSFGSSDDEFATGVTLTSSNGYAIAGYRKFLSGNSFYNSIQVLKLNAAGNLIANVSFSSGINEKPATIRETHDMGFVVCGHITSDGGFVSPVYANGDFLVFKLDSTLSAEWAYAYGGSNYDEAFDLALAPDSGFVIVGTTSSNDFDVAGYKGDGDFWVLKLDKDGLIEWQKTLGGSNVDYGRGIETCSDGYIVAGTTSSNDNDVSGFLGAYDIWVVKLNFSGNIVWQKCLGGPNIETAANAIRKTTDGGYIVVGSAENDGGDVTGNHGDYDFWVVKLASDVVAIEEINHTSKHFGLFPNPAHSSITLVDIVEGSTIKILDLSGKLLSSTVAVSGYTRIDVSGFSAGIYFVAAEQNGVARYQKFVVSQ